MTVTTDLAHILFEKKLYRYTTDLLATDGFDSSIKTGKQKFPCMPK